MANKQNFTDPNRSDWNTEERWWRDNFSSRPYVLKNATTRAGGWVEAFAVAKTPQ